MDIYYWRPELFGMPCNCMDYLAVEDYDGMFAPILVFNPNVNTNTIYFINGYTRTTAMYIIGNVNNIRDVLTAIMPIVHYLNNVKDKCQIEKLKKMLEIFFKGINLSPQENISVITTRLIDIWLNGYFTARDDRRQHFAIPCWLNGLRNKGEGLYTYSNDYGEEDVCHTIYCTEQGDDCYKLHSPTYNMYDFLKNVKSLGFPK